MWEYWSEEKEEWNEQVEVEGKSKKEGSQTLVLENHKKVSPLGFVHIFSFLFFDVGNIFFWSMACNKNGGAGCWVSFIKCPSLGVYNMPSVAKKESYI